MPAGPVTFESTRNWKGVFRWTISILGAVSYDRLDCSPDVTGAERAVAC